MENTTETASHNRYSYFHRSWQFHLPWTCIVTVSLIFYIWVVYKLRKNNKKEPFDSSFFALWLNLGYVDICTTISIWLFFKIEYASSYIEAIAWFYGNFMENWPRVYYSMKYPIGFYFLNAGFVGVVILSLNRFTSVVFPFRHKTVKYIFRRFRFSFIRVFSYGSEAN